MEWRADDDKNRAARGFQPLTGAAISSVLSSIQWPGRQFAPAAAMSRRTAWRGSAANLRRHGRAENPARVQPMIHFRPPGPPGRRETRL
jgi:hypothetical protein